jgi:hypothetical protein
MHSPTRTELDRRVCVDAFVPPEVRGAGEGRRLFSEARALRSTVSPEHLRFRTVRLVARVVQKGDAGKRQRHAAKAVFEGMTRDGII